VSRTTRSGRPLNRRDGDLTQSGGRAIDCEDAIREIVSERTDPAASARGRMARFVWGRPGDVNRARESASAERAKPRRSRGRRRWSQDPHIGAVDDRLTTTVACGSPYFFVRRSGCFFHHRTQIFVGVARSSPGSTGPRLTHCPKSSARNPRSAAVPTRSTPSKSSHTPALRNWF